MKTVLICGVITLSGASLGFLALGDGDEKCCPFCANTKDPSSKAAVTSKAVESKEELKVNQVTQSSQKPDAPAYTCLLTPTELKERSAATNAQIIARADEIVETQTGYKLKFAEADDKLVTTLAEWINVERKCCSFFRFELAFDQFAGPVWLDVGGDAGAKQFLKKVLDKNTIDQ